MNDRIFLACANIWQRVPTRLNVLSHSGTMLKSFIGSHISIRHKRDIQMARMDLWDGALAATGAPLHVATTELSKMDARVCTTNSNLPWKSVLKSCRRDRFVAKTKSFKLDSLIGLVMIVWGCPRLSWSFCRMSACILYVFFYSREQ